MTSVMWFRRDLRLADNPALLEAVADGADGADGAGVLPLFVLDPRLWGPAGVSRRAYLGESLRSLDASLRSRPGGDGGLQVVRGDPVRRVLLAAREVGATRVHVAADFGPYGAERDREVEQALAEHDIELVRTGSPYAVAPGRVTKGDGSPYAVFTPFHKAWSAHGWRAPVDPPRAVSYLTLGDTTDVPGTRLPDGLSLPTAGEAAARRRWRSFLDERLADYGRDRDQPGIPGTSRISVHLKWGEIHPRTMLADLSEAGGAGSAKYRAEIAWREFYADVLHHRPETARDYLRPEFARMDYEEPDDLFEKWKRGATGFPIVDAGMRELRATGWMHNRVRMIVASFLVKDLHVEWQHGARHFMQWLVDGDLASNQHGWQWTAGSGTDAAPYFRVFNPITQSKKFDPDGSYVRRWVPELADADDPHEPVDPIVDHAEERREALARWERIRR